MLGGIGRERTGEGQGIVTGHEGDHGCARQGYSRKRAGWDQVRYRAARRKEGGLRRRRKLWSWRDDLPPGRRLQRTMECAGNDGILRWQFWFSDRRGSD